MLRLIKAQRLDLDVIGQTVLNGGVKGYRFRMSFLLLLLAHHQLLEALMAFGAENGIALLWIKELHIEWADICDVELCAADGDGISHMVGAAVRQGKIKAVIYGLRFRFDAVETAFIHIAVEVLARHGDRLLFRAVWEGVIYGFLIDRIQMDADINFVSGRTGVEVVAGMEHCAAQRDEGRAVAVFHVFADIGDGVQVHIHAVYAWTGTDILIVHGARLGDHAVDTVLPPGMFKEGLAGDHILLGVFAVGELSFFFLRDLLRICHHLLNEGVAVQRFRVNDFTVDDPGLSQSLPNGSRVNIVEVIQLLIGVELFTADQTHHAPLHVPPRQRGFFYAGQLDRKGIQLAAVFLPQPLVCAAFPAMLLHIPEYPALAGNVAVPALNRMGQIILIRCSQRPGLTESTGAVSAELRFMGVDSRCRFMVDGENTAYFMAAALNG